MSAGIKPPTCGEGSPKCQAFLAPGYNPLRFCRAHLAKYRERSGSDVVVGDPGVTLDVGHTGANR